MAERLEARLAEPFRALMRAARVARQRLAGQATEVQSGTLGVLAAINTAGDGCHPKELAVRCALDASTISRAVAALVARGLVERTVDPADRRACLLGLTDAGHAALTDLERQQTDLLAAALRDWTDPEVDAFATALTLFLPDRLRDWRTDGPTLTPGREQVPQPVMAARS